MTFCFVISLSDAVSNISTVPSSPTDESENLYVPLGNEIQCKAKGKPEPTFTWTCDNMDEEIQGIINI